IMPVDQSQEILAEGLNISEEALEVRVGEARQLNADVVPSNASNREVLWTSSDPDCLQVLDSGLIIPLSEGTATITATTQDGTEIEKTCVVTVSNPVTSIEILGARTMYLGDENTPAETLQLQAIVLPEDATDSSVIWT
ncbi:MAG: Ig domain-containing protein, partial [Lachnospiraceae bacterium]